MLNLYKAYYKDYFSELDFHPLLEYSDKSLDKTKIDNNLFTRNGLLVRIPEPVDGLDKFELKISYPGLVTGIGIPHEVKIEGGFKLGVHFDYTRGMPVIYGSSVKGVLREYFRHFKNSELLWKDIFEGSGKNMYARDIFYDAVLVAPDRQGRILCSDSITPHKNPLKNPIPITFLKIAPGCKVQFRFKLFDSIVDGVRFSKEEKLDLFKKILLTVGIGAKTNVGYGQFE